MSPNCSAQFQLTDQSQYVRHQSLKRGIGIVSKGCAPTPIPDPIKKTAIPMNLREFVSDLWNNRASNS
jgi:hypothetical protein